MKRAACNDEPSSQNEAPLLSSELMENLGSDAIILPSKKKKKKKRGMAPTPTMIKQAAKLSKSKAKKLAKLEEKKVKGAKRKELFAELKKNQLSADHMKLMYSSGKLGGKETMKERVVRSFNLQKAGIEDHSTNDEITSASDNILYQPRESIENKEMIIPEQQPIGTSDEEGSGDDDDDAENDDAATVIVDSSANVVSNDSLKALLALKEKNKAKREAAAASTSSSKTRQEFEAANALQFKSSSAPYIPNAIDIQSLLKTTDISSPLIQKTVVINLNRRPEIQAVRLALPVVSSEQEIMEAIATHDIMILCGETGSGKTTQVPQFLYEAGYGAPSGSNPGMIGVTQPRRVAAVSTATRVADELNVGFGKAGHVGYQIRYDSQNVGKETRIKFMTDGILLKEVQQDFLLRRYSCIIIDEAHERNVNTDILIGLLSRIIPLRNKIASEEANEANAISPLKLVIMSATLRVEDFTENTVLFPNPPPVLKVEARQYPVTIHFNKVTELENYVDAAFKKVAKIHRKLPMGGILVFLTGKQEIVELCRKLERAFGKSATSTNVKKTKRIVKEEETEVIREHDDDEDEAALEHESIYGKLESSSSEEDEEEDISTSTNTPAHVLPLYSLLDSERQLQVFSPPPEGHRLIIVATNVAETSLTIPGISYVVDAGRTKERVFDEKSCISEFKVTWVSKASANQRAGRAGRTGPGHCYRLYSSAVFDNEFAKFSDPEILCRPIEDLVLSMKIMGIDHVADFPFPTAPDRMAITNAISTLRLLGAITPDTERITALGKMLGKFPLAPRFAKMLLLAAASRNKMHLSYTIAIVASLTGQSPFILPHDDDIDSESKTSSSSSSLEQLKEKDERLERFSQWHHPSSDILAQLRAAGAYAFAGATRSFCDTNFLREKIMSQSLKLRVQLTRIVNQVDHGVSATRSELDRSLPPPNDTQENFLKQIITAGMLDNVAKLLPAGVVLDGSKLDRRCAYQSCNKTIKEPLYIHPHSVVFSSDPGKLPEYVVYQSVQRTTKAYMKGLTIVDKKWLMNLAAGSPLLKMSPPLTEPLPKYNKKKDCVECFRTGKYGDHSWELPLGLLPMEDEEKYRWFGRFLLQGDVIPVPFTPRELKDKPSRMTMKVTDPKVEFLVKALCEADIASKASLKHILERNPKFLSKELSAWLRQSSQIQLQGCF